jgi:hypothetical protein
LLVILGAMLFLSSRTVWTQEATGKTSTFDHQGAVIPDAEATNTNSATGITSTGLTKRPDNGTTTTQGPGAGAMKMDHSHRFISTHDGGHIVMQRDARDADDSAAVARIRQHIKEIAGLFAAGDFRLPPGVESPHEVPGTRVMAVKSTAISYLARPLPRGAEVVISSRDASAIHAIHEFLRFHAAEHRALGSGGR